MTFPWVIAILLVLSDTGYTRQILTATECDELQNVQKAVEETAAVGTVIQSFSMAEGAHLSIEPAEDSDLGYLEMRSTDQVYNIMVNKSLDLNAINPGTQCPNTVEEVNCTCDDSSTTPPAKQEVNYKLYCTSPENLYWDITIAIIPVHELAPQFYCDPYYTVITELTLVDTVVFVMQGLAHDPDYGGYVSYYSLASTGGGHFKMGDAASQGRILVAAGLDYDYAEQSYILNVTATDRDSPPRSNWTLLHINLTDGDDLPPSFSELSYQLTLTEQDPDGIGLPVSSIPPVYAYDLDIGINATIQYTLLSGHFINGTKCFDQNSATGEIMPLCILDREITDEYTIYLEAYQMDRPLERRSRSMLQVIVEDINDHPPVMSAELYTVHIPENLPTGQPVTKVHATDLDTGDNAVFKFLIEDNSDAFTINITTGEVFVKNHLLLDREQRDYINFTVYAQEVLTAELHQSARSEVRVELTDTNDNNPVFLPVNPIITLNEGVTTGQIIALVEATDDDIGDNAEILYHIGIFPNVSSDWLAINSSTGEVFVHQDFFPSDDITVYATVTAEDQPNRSTYRRYTSLFLAITILASGTTPKQSTLDDIEKETTIQYITAEQIGYSTGVVSQDVDRTTILQNTHSTDYQRSAPDEDIEVTTVSSLDLTPDKLTSQIHVVNISLSTQSIQGDTDSVLDQQSTTETGFYTGQADATVLGIHSSVDISLEKSTSSGKMQTQTITSERHTYSKTEYPHHQTQGSSIRDNSDGKTTYLATDAYGQLSSVTSGVQLKSDTTSYLSDITTQSSESLSLPDATDFNTNTVTSDDSQKTDASWTEASEETSEEQPDSGTEYTTSSMPQTSATSQPDISLPYGGDVTQQAIPITCTPENQDDTAVLIGLNVLFGVLVLILILVCLYLWRKMQTLQNSSNSSISSTYTEISDNHNGYLDFQ